MSSPEGGGSTVDTLHATSGNPSQFDGGLAVQSRILQSGGSNQWAQKATLSSGTATITFAHNYIAKPVVVVSVEGANTGKTVFVSSYVGSGPYTGCVITSDDAADTRVVNVIIIGNAS